MKPDFSSARDASAPDTQLIVDYSIAPSLLVRSYPGLGVEVHPKRTDIVEIDTAGIGTFCPIGPGEGALSFFEYWQRLRENLIEPLDVRVMEELLKPDNSLVVPDAFWELAPGSKIFFLGTIHATYHPQGIDGEFCPFIEVRPDRQLRHGMMRDMPASAPLYCASDKLYAKDFVAYLKQSAE